MSVFTVDFRNFEAADLVSKTVEPNIGRNPS